MKRSKNPDHDVVKLKLSKAKSAQKLFIKFIYQKILFGPSIPIQLMYCNAMHTAMQCHSLYAWTNGFC